MVAFLAGKILNKGQGFVLVRVNDIGYKVFVNASMYADLKIGCAVDMYTHQHVREDSLDLYGFKSLADLEMFELLLSISGIGPKSALGVLAIAGVGEIQESIAGGDPALLTKVSGIGKKTAERVVLELREKIRRITADSRQPGLARTDGGALVCGDEIDALMALGYSLAQARDALRLADPGFKDSGERIKEALKKLGKN